MKIKNFVIAGIAGGITDFLLGWVFYGMLFREYFGGEEPNLTFIFLGCMAYGFFMSYLLVNWANAITLVSGLKAGATVGFFVGLTDNLFRLSMGTTVIDYQRILVDIIIYILMGAGLGAAVAATNGALSKPAS
ncbi:MAG TPA: hypothetical protein VK623_10645 [Flavobacterium sp.]|nr:hypothetical protein [Flavobacterium sp.]